MAIRPSLARIVLARIVLGAVFALAQHHAFAASSLLGTIADVLRFPAAVPLPVFDGIKPKPLPGAPVLGLTERNYSGVAVVDVSRMRVCAIADAIPPLRLPIAGFLQRFSAAESADELRLLFGLTDPDIQNIDSYEVLLTGGVSFAVRSTKLKKTSPRRERTTPVRKNEAISAAAQGRPLGRRRPHRRVRRPAAVFPKHRRQGTGGRRPGRCRCPTEMSV